MIWRIIFGFLLVAVLAWLALVVRGAAHRLLHSMMCLRSTLDDLKRAVQDQNRELKSIGTALEDAGRRADRAQGSTERALHDIKDTLAR